jgi:hypothetical protein
MNVAVASLLPLHGVPLFSVIDYSQFKTCLHRQFAFADHLRKHDLIFSVIVSKFYVSPYRYLHRDSLVLPL